MWALPVARATGGRDAGVLTLGLVACVPGLLVVLPRAVAACRVRPRTVVLAVLLPVGALVVCLTAPTGWAGGSNVAACAYVGLLGLLVFGYCASAGRRLVVATLVCLAGLIQFAEAWVPWWGGGIHGAAMIGTFYWHNQFAIFLVPAALIGLAVALWRVAPVRSLGWVVTPLCVAGVVLSTSRASAAALIGGWVLVGGLAVRVRSDRRRVLVRFAAVSLLAVLAPVVLSGPPFFDHFYSPAAATRVRTEGQPLSQNGAHRVEFWQQSVAVFEHWPVTGAGFDSLGTAASPLTAADLPRSPYTHNGYLQAFSDGGLVLGLPLLLLGGLATWLSVRLLWALWRKGRPRRRPSRPVPEPSPGSRTGAPPDSLPEPVLAQPESWLATAGPVALVLLLAHSFFDFDWSYPALFAEAGILFGLVASLGLPRKSGRAAQPIPVPDTPARESGSIRPVGYRSGYVWSLTAACIVVACLAAVVDSARDCAVADYQSARQESVSERVAALWAASQRVLADYHPAQDILQIAEDNPAATPRDVVVGALTDTARAATAVPRLQLLRARVQARVLGQPEQALATAAPLMSQLAGRPAYVVDIARVLVSAGRTGQARALLEAASRQLPRDASGAELRTEIQQELARLRG